tara:strand:+ start:1419 stop:2342 length:924 start_codon:yes stop_codon:yes gene_type:complete
MFSKVKRLIQLIKSYEERFNKIDLTLGKIETRLNQSIDSDYINDYEFKVSSQWGEDGIIQYLINNINIKNTTFVEFGVEKYTESNTRFLLQNNNWNGLVLDGSSENISYIKNDPIYWKHSLKAEHAFLTAENINQIISSNGISGDIGLLSIDVDGNDYWLWEAINCISPNIVVVEFNSLFGKKEKVSVPYKSNFVWTNEHFSNLYWGASLAAMEYLGEKKGYSLVGINSVSSNAFFVKDEMIGNVRKTNSKEAHSYSSFRQSRNEKGELTFLDINECLVLISDCTLQRVDTFEKFKVSELFGNFNGM